MDLFRLLAIYLPQFYPIPENDQFWGKGFTEWTNVVKARKKFNGHYQPHLPADLGFYDLRVPEVLFQQAEMAKKYGIYGFCFYHYWFSGKRILEKPLDIYVDKKVDFPFCLCWANQDWTRTWSGNEGDILLKQQYSLEDDKQHIHYLAQKYFSQQNYIKVDGKPVFIIYRPALFPDIKQTTDLWRSEIKKFGFKDLYLIHMETDFYRINPDAIGFDAGVDFHPHSKNLPKRINNHWFNRRMNKHKLFRSPFVNNFVWDYADYANKNKFTPPNDYLLYPSLFPMWDNSARKNRNAWIFLNSSPEAFSNWLKTILKRFRPSDKQRNFIFINAWNEWAEGNHLEPCQKWGHEYLKAVKHLVTINKNFK